MSRIHYAEMQQSLSGEIVRTIRILYIAIGSGATFFLAVVLVLFNRGLPSGPGTAGAVHNMGMLTVIHGAMVLSGLWISRFLYDRAFQEKQVRAVTGKTDTSLEIGPADIIAVIRTARILKLAIIEGIAFFGLVICFMGVSSGAIYREPVYWVNLVSYGLLVSSVYRDFPTREKLLAEVKAKLGYLFM